MTTFLPHGPRHRTAAALAAGALLLGGLAACSSGSLADTGDGATSGDGGGGGELRKVSLILDWTPNTNHSGVYLAAAKGYFADAGLDVDIVEPGDTSGSQLVAAGQADFAISVAESLVPARSEGLDLVSIAAIIQHNTSSLISLTDTGITRPKDLEGKVFGGYDSPLEHAIIDALVREDGGDPTKVTFVPVGSDDVRIGLTQHQYDTTWVFDAWDTIRLEDVDGLDVSTLAFADYFDYVPDWYTPIFVTSAKTVADDPDLVQAFVGAVSKGYQDAIADPAGAAATLLDADPELDADLVGKSAVWLGERYTDTPAKWGYQDKGTWDTFVSFLEDNEIVPAGQDADAAWTNDFLPAD